MHLITKRILTITALLLLVGCNQQQKPDQLIPEQTYIKLITELQLVESASDVDTVDQEAMTRRVFNKYSVTRKQFIESHRYYSDDVPRQQKRIKMALEYLKSESKQRIDSTGTAAPDSAEPRNRTPQ